MAVTEVLSLIARLSLDSSAYESGLAKAEQSAGSIGSTIGGAVGGIAKAAGVALAGASTAVVAFGKSSIDAGMSFDSAMSQVAATMGVTTAEMEDSVGSVDLAWGSFSGNLRDYAQVMGANTAFSATQAAEALNYMALAGYKTQESMDMLPNVLNLAAAGAMDLGAASDMVTDTQTAFGISFERTGQMVDEMAKAASTGNTSVSQLGEAFLTVGALAQNLSGGMVELSDGTKVEADGIQELEIALTAMANAGIKGSEAGTHIRNMLLKLASPTADGVGAMSQLGLSVFDAEGNMRSLKDILSDMKNVMDGDVAPVLERMYDGFSLLSDDEIQKRFEKDAEQFQILGVSIVDSNGKLREFNEVYDQLKDGVSQETQMQLISDLFNTYDVAAVQSLLEAVDQDWDAIGESILDAENAAEDMANTQLDNLAGDFTLFQSALEGARIAVSDQLTPSLRDFVQLGTEGLSEITSAFQEDGLSGAMEAFGGWLGDALGMIVEKIPEIIDAGAQVLTAFISGLSGNMTQVSDAAVQIITSLSQMMITNIPVLAEAGLNLMMSMAGSISQALPQIATTAQEIVGSLVTNIRENLPTLISTGLQAMLEFSGSLRENIGMIVDAAIEIALALGQGLIDSLPAIIQNVPTIVSNIAGIINDNAPKILAAGVQLIGSLIKGLIDSIPVIIQEMPKIIAAIWDVITAVNWVNLGTSIITGIKNGITQMGAALKGAGKTLVENFKTNFTNLPNAFLEIGKNIIQGLINGIKSMGSSVVSHVGEIASSILSTVKSFFGINSPSTVFESIGNFIMQGLANGLMNSLTSVVNTAKSISSNILGAVKGFFGISSPARVMDEEVGQMLGAGEIEGMRKMFPKLKETASEMSDLLFENAIPDVPTIDMPEVRMPEVTYGEVFTSGNSGNFTSSPDNRRIEQLLTTIVETLQSMGVTIDGKALVGYLAPTMNNELGKIYRQGSREVTWA